MKSFFKKKFLILAIAVMAAFSAQAQTPMYETPAPQDNISVTIKTGVTTPVNHSWHIRSISGLELCKQLTPITGIGIEGQWTVNTSYSKTAFDHQYVGVLATSNMMNLFGGYPGIPRKFEIETVLGAGWLHEYVNGPGDFNSWYTKYGLNLNYNINDAFTVSLKPSIIYDMEDGSHTRYNVNQASLDLQVGFTYRFMNTNGTRHFKIFDKKYTQAEYDALNAEINNLRAQTPQVVEKIVERQVVQTVSVSDPTIRNVVGFTINSDKITGPFYSNLANVAELIKSNDQKVLITGYADKNTGTAEYNKDLAERRAEAVKNVLVNEFGIDPTRLVTKAVGSDEQIYQENDWNRTVTFQFLK